jgi:hypothetical protein
MAFPTPCSTGLGTVSTLAPMWGRDGVDAENGSIAELPTKRDADGCRPWASLARVSTDGGGRADVPPILPGTAGLDVPDVRRRTLDTAQPAAAAARHAARRVVGPAHAAQLSTRTFCTFRRELSSLRWPCYGGGPPPAKVERREGTADDQRLHADSRRRSRELTHFCF